MISRTVVEKAVDMRVTSGMATTSEGSIAKSLITIPGMQEAWLLGLTVEEYTTELIRQAGETLHC
jgi:hypothetical protein